MAFFRDVKKARKGSIGGQLRFLDKNQLEEIDNAAKNVLWHMGVKIPHEDALNILDNVGCNVDYINQIVCIPPYLVEESIRKAPHEFTYAGWNHKNSIKIDAKKVYFVCGAGGGYIINPDGSRYKPSIIDHQNIMRLMDACENVDVGGSGIFSFPDTPKEYMNLPLPVRRVRRYLLDIEATEKPVDITKNYLIDRERISVEQAKQEAIDRIYFEAAVRGGIDKLRKTPMSAGPDEVVSPLIHDVHNVEKLLIYAKHGLPTLIGSEPMAGATSPATVAGTLVLWTAETLSCLVLAQMAASKEHRPPAIWVTLAGLFDQITAAGPLFSSPEGILMQAASAQIAHMYNFPIRGIAETASKLPDTQSGYETALGLSLSALAGINYNTSVGLLGPGQIGTSYEKIILDDDLIGYIKRVMEGIDVCNETLATDVIFDVGHGGNYLLTKHTRKFAKIEHVYPKIFNRSIYENWVKQGKIKALDSAHERVQEILKNHWPEPLDEEIRRRVVEYIDKIEKRESNKR